MSSHNNLSPEEREKALITYQALRERRITTDTLMWQVPALSLAAQSFLFQISLGSDTRIESRLITLFLAFVSSILSMLLMAKHRFSLIQDSLLLENIERKLKLLVVHGAPIDRADIANKYPKWYEKFSAYKVWMWGLATFAGTSLILFILIMILAIKRGSFYDLLLIFIH